VILTYFSLGIPDTEAGKASSPTFAARADMVFVKTTVSDRLNRRVAGLPREYFHIYEDSVEQNILSFAEEPAPVGIRLICDVSGSMSGGGRMQEAQTALVRLLNKKTDPRDEFFLLTFSQKPTLVIDFTSDAASVQRHAGVLKPHGNTALYDAVYMGLDKIRTVKNERKAIIIFSDFEDNCSRYEQSEVKDYAKELDVQIYTVGPPMIGSWRINGLDFENIAGMTGGRAFSGAKLAEIEQDFELIYSELRNEYVLGYSPTSGKHDGKWRRIQVRLDKSVPKVIVHARAGYYTAKP
jgi:Ca-activated chloride channel family protein